MHASCYFLPMFLLKKVFFGKLEKKPKLYFLAFFRQIDQSIFAQNCVLVFSDGSRAVLFATTNLFATMRRREDRAHPPNQQHICLCVYALALEATANLPHWNKKERFFPLSCNPFFFRVWGLKVLERVLLLLFCITIIAAASETNCKNWD